MKKVESISFKEKIKAILPIPISAKKGDTLYCKRDMIQEQIVGERYTTNNELQMAIEQVKRFYPHVKPGKFFSEKDFNYPDKSFCRCRMLLIEKI